MRRHGPHFSIVPILLLFGLGKGAVAQGLPVAVSAAGSASAMAITVQGTANGIPVRDIDPNNQPFVDWTPFQTGLSISAAQTTNIRSMEMSLTAPGNVTFTSLAGNVMTLPYTAIGVYQLPFVPARIDLGSGTAATFWALR